MYDFIEVLEIEDVEQVEDTYDITVENTHNFFANGMLVHNCLGGYFSSLCYWPNKDKGEKAILESFRNATERMVSIFGDRFYGELQWNNVKEQHELNRYILQMKEEYGIGIVSTADSHYPNPDAWKDRELYKRLGWVGKSKPDYAEGKSELPTGVEEIGYELYPKNGDQMWEAYKKYSTSCGATYDDAVVMDSITTTYKIAHERIESFMPDNTVRLPDFVVPEGSTADDALATMAFDGLRRKNLHNKKEYTERMDLELSVISSQGFSKYFLTMKAIMDKSMKTQLVGPARGSAAGCLLAYALEITQVDPIRFGLMFERFMTKNQVGMPDIDTDHEEPFELKQQLIKDWGETTVVPISNFTTLQHKSLIKDISKFYNIPFQEVNNVTMKMIAEATPQAKKANDIKSGMYIPTFDEIKSYSSTLQGFLAKYPHIATQVEKLSGQVRNVSAHAAGCLVGENLDYHMPLINVGGIRQTPWAEGQNVRHLEPMGFIKFDILGLASLRMIHSCIRHILKRKYNNPKPTFEDVKAYYYEYLHPDKINLNDKKVFKNVFQKGNFVGTFQFTNRGAQEFCKNVKPTNIDELSAITSIYRPGPLSAKVDRLYIAAKTDPGSIAYSHKLIKEVLHKNYGFIIYQEDLAQLAHKLGKDIDLEEGNKLRKLLIKKGTGAGFEEKDKIHKKFIEGCTEKGISKMESQDLWQKMEYFAQYSFNKSHSVSYCIVSYQCAWLSTYFPDCWAASFLDKENDADKERAINIVKSKGFKIESLNVNTSGTEWEISDDGTTLIPPLTSIKGLGEVAIQQIINNRPFNTVEEFLFNDKMSYSKLNKKAIDVLCRSGAMNKLIDSRFTGGKHFWSAVAVDRPRKLKDFEANVVTYAPEGQFTQEETILYLTELTGVYPINLVVSTDILTRLQEKCIPPISEYDPELGLVWFIPKELIKKKTATGKEYWLLNAIDDTNTETQIKCWGIKEGDVVKLHNPYMGKLDHDDTWGFSLRSMKHQIKVLT